MEKEKLDFRELQTQYDKANSLDNKIDAERIKKIEKEMRQALIMRNGGKSDYKFVFVNKILDIKTCSINELGTINRNMSLKYTMDSAINGTTEDCKKTNN